MISNGSMLKILGKRFAEADNYVLYYGHGQEKEAANFDIAILESQGQSAESVRWLKENNTVCIAYMSVIEVADYTREKMLLGQADLLKRNDLILRNEKYAASLADPRSKNWSRILLNKASELYHAGYDGIFLDTMADIESPMFSRSEKNEIILALIEIIQKINQRHPQGLLIQNNGVEEVCLYTAGLIDGICWDNPPLEKEESAAWVSIIKRRLKRISDENNLKLFILYENDDYSGLDINKIKNEVCQEGFLFYHASQSYTGRINLFGQKNNPIKGLKGF